MSLRKKLEAHRIFRKTSAAAHELNYLFWETTLRCNLSCEHCGSDCTSDTTTEEMPVEDFLAVLSEVAGYYTPSSITVVITGGEALLRKDLEEAGDAIRKLGFPWGIVTNGCLLDEKRMRSLLASGMRAMTISLDGLEDEHNRIRGVHSYKKTLEAIRLASRASRQAGLVFDVVSCIRNGNFHQIEPLKQLLIDEGVPAWRIFNIFPKGRAAGKSELDISPENFKDQMVFIQKVRDEGEILLNYACEGFLGPHELVVRDTPYFCRAGITIGSVLADGSVSACPSLRGDYIQGNIYKNSFMEIWMKRFQKMRKRKWLKTGECKSCSSFKYCEGNGLHLRDEKSGELLRCHLKMLEC